MSTTVADFVFALGLLVVYALGFAIVFVWLGLVSGNAQAAQGLEHPRGAVLVHLERVRAHRHDAGRGAGVRQGAAAHVHGELVARPAPRRRRRPAPSTTASRTTSIGSLLWSAVIALVFTPLAMRSYRKR